MDEERNALRTELSERESDLRKAIADFEIAMKKEKHEWTMEQDAQKRLLERQADEVRYASETVSIKSTRDQQLQVVIGALTALMLFRVPVF